MLERIRQSAPVRPFLADVSADPGRLRIAFTDKTLNGIPVAEDGQRVLQEAAALCADLSHEVEEALPDVEGNAIVPTFRTISAWNILNGLRGHPSGRLPERGEVETVVWNTAWIAADIDGAAFLTAQQTAHRIGRQMAAFHADYDVLLTPGLATLPPELGWLDMILEDLDEYWRRIFGFSPFTVWFSNTGQLAIMLPLGRNVDGFPMAVQLVAPYGEDAT